MENLTKRSFNINLKLMRILHLYLPEKATCLYKVRAYVIYFLFAVHVPLFGILNVLLEKDINFEDNGDNAFILAEVICCVFKLMPFITNSDRIRKLIHYFDCSMFNNLTQQHKSIIDVYISICRRNTRIFLILVLSAYILWSARPFFLTDRKLPIDVWLPVSTTDKPISFYFIYIYVVLGVGYPGFASAMIDPLIAGLACTAVGQLKVLKIHLQYLCEHAEDEYICQISSKKTPIKSDIMYQKIKQCIEYHNAISYFVKHYEECFSFIVFSQLMGSIFVLCLCCFQLNMLKPTSLGFLQTLVCLIVFLIQIYFYCYYGTLLVDEGNTLIDSIYMGKWYEYDIKSKKALIILMERSKEPMKVTAGKVFDLSLETFTTILKRSYSLLAVLKNH